MKTNRRSKKIRVSSNQRMKSSPSLEHHSARQLHKTHALRGIEITF
ncbi:MAG: hypothetical protein WBE30_10450 [Candidatus Cybelea sp.]